MAEELNQLLAHGWRVFHDVPFEGFNIDHVAVGQTGIFAVETKTRRKWKDRATKNPAHIVRYDGRQFTWPSGATNGFGLEQAERNARTLGDWLTKATGEEVNCRPVLTLPGWWIETTGNEGRVLVGASKGLHRLLLRSGSGAITADQLRRIAYQLEERCRPAGTKLDLRR